jgi:hypothetical protein
MFVEDIIATMADSLSPRSPDGKFVISLSRRVLNHQPLTTRQGFAFLSFLRKSSYLWSHTGAHEGEIRALLTSPKWKMPLEESKTIHHEVRYLGDNYIGFRTARSRATESDFRALEASWAFGMHVVQTNSPARLEKAVRVIGEHGFQMDAALEDYLAEAFGAEKLPSSAMVAGDLLVIDVPNDNLVAEFVLHVLMGEPV